MGRPYNFAHIISVSDSPSVLPSLTLSIFYWILRYTVFINEITLTTHVNRWIVIIRWCERRDICQWQSGVGCWTHTPSENWFHQRESSNMDHFQSVTKTKLGNFKGETLFIVFFNEPKEEHYHSVLSLCVSDSLV